VSSTDTAPALLALGASVRLVSATGERTLALEQLYRNDGIEYLTRQPGEILTDVRLESSEEWKSTYWKLRRRGSFDFPVLSVAAALRLGKGQTVAQARIVLGAVASQPLLCEAAGSFLEGKKLTDTVIVDAAVLATKLAKPMDNTDFTLHWRKRVTTEFVGFALRELRGDDMRDQRRRIARHVLDSAVA
jgi:CO/xanthine dehydrogenase FAD-binding subunit